MFIISTVAIPSSRPTARINDQVLSIGREERSTRFARCHRKSKSFNLNKPLNNVIFFLNLGFGFLVDRMCVPSLRFLFRADNVVKEKLGCER